MSSEPNDPRSPEAQLLSEVEPELRRLLSKLQANPHCKSLELTHTRQDARLVVLCRSRKSPSGEDEFQWTYMKLRVVGHFRDLRETGARRARSPISWPRGSETAAVGASHQEDHAPDPTVQQAYLNYAARLVRRRLSRRPGDNVLRVLHEDLLRQIRSKTTGEAPLSEAATDQV